MALAGKQARGRIQSDPSGARQIHFAPGVQIGEIVARARRSVRGSRIGHELNEIARDEARGEPQVPQQLNQQFGRVAAGSGLLLEGVFGQLHAGFHTNHIAHVGGETPVQLDEKIDGGAWLARHRAEIGCEQRGQRASCQKRRELAFLGRTVLEGNCLRVRLQEKIKGILNRHFRGQIDLHPQILRRLRKYHAGQVIGLRVLLPIDEVFGRLDVQGVGQNAAAAMWCGAQPNDLWPQLHQSIVAIMHDVIERYVNRHYADPSLAHRYSSMVPWMKRSLRMAGAESRNG